MEKNEKLNRKEILRNLKQKQNEELLNSLPFSKENVKSLFDFLDSKLSESGCDHSFKFVAEFSLSINANLDQVTIWLNNNGAWCDCEALANVEEKYESLI